MSNIKRRISFTKGLQEELDDRVHRTNDLVTDLSTIDGSASFDDKYIGANAWKTNNTNNNLKYADIVSDVTTIDGSAAFDTQVVSANDFKAVKDAIDAASGGLVYKGIFDASGATLPADVGKGFFYKVSVAGTIDGLEMAVGDMIIANKDVVGASTAADFDKVDNTEALDILRDGDTTLEADWNLEGSKLSDRATTKTFVEDAISAVSMKFINEQVTIATDGATLSHTPANDVIFTGVASVNNGDGTFDLVECSCTGTTLSISPDTAGAYDGLVATVTYAYV
jgi:hypothetical protein